MNFQAYLENAFRIIKEEPLILILGGLVVQVLTVLSLGILSGPVMGGYTLLVILYLRDNKKPVFSDIFSGLQQFTKLFPYFLVLLFIFIGLTLFILPGLLFATWWIYVLPLMVDRKMSFMDAMRLSMSTVNEKGFLMHLVFLLLISFIPIVLINLVSAIIPLIFILKILLPPFQIACLASLYIDQFPVSAIEPDILTDTPPLQNQETDEEKPSRTDPDTRPLQDDQPADAGTTSQDVQDIEPDSIEETEAKKTDTD